MSQAIDSFLSALRRLCPNVTEAALQYLKEGLTVTELNNKHFYIHADSLQKEIGYVYKGLLRAFYIDERGNEISVNFIGENSYATHYSAFISQTPCKYYFQCLEQSILVNLTYAHIQEGYKQHPTLERYGRLIAEEVLKIQQKRIESFLFDDAEARYIQYVSEYPEIAHRISISDLSSYLGITRQSLTRIRRKLARRGN
jgi:CRP-like cAMP-binding protein